MNPSVNVSEPKYTQVNQSEPECEPEWTLWTPENPSEPEWTQMNTYEPNWAQLQTQVWTPVWTWVNLSEHNWT